MGSRIVGALFVAIAVFGAIAGVRATVNLRDAEAERAAATAAAIDGSLKASASALTAAGETVGIVESMVSQISGSLVTVEDAALDLTTTIDDSEEAVRRLAELGNEDLPTIIESLQDAMPALIQVANVIDGTLGALSFVGVPYDPEEPFDDSLRRVEASISDLPARIREMAALVGDTADDLATIGSDAGGLVVELGTVRTQLDDAVTLLGNYRLATEEARDTVAATVGSLDSTAATERSMILLLGVAFVALQLVPLYLGLSAFARREDAVTP